jgi:hypothetical protein
LFFLCDLVSLWSVINMNCIKHVGYYFFL